MEKPQTKPREELLRCLEGEEEGAHWLPKSLQTHALRKLTYFRARTALTKPEAGQPIFSPNWQEAVRAAVQTFAATAATRNQVIARIDRLENEITALKEEVAELREAQSVQAVIASLADESYDLVKHIPVVIQGAGDEWTATFFDANIAISGDTQEEAVDNLKGLIVDMFESLEEDKEILGLGPAKQLTTLRDFIQRRIKRGQTDHERVGDQDRPKTGGSSEDQEKRRA